MRKRITCILLALFMVLSLISCGSTPGNADPDASAVSEPEEIVPTGIMMPVADYAAVKFSLNDYNVPYVWTGDDFVYMMREWDKEARINICTLYRIPAAGVGEPVQFYQSTLEGPSIWRFTMDRDENIYTLSWVPSGSDRIWSLHKYDKDMNELFSRELTDLGFPSGTINHVSEINVDSNGNIVMLDLSSSGVYLFDQDFNYLGKDSVKMWTQDGRFLDAGCFFWDYDYETNETQIQKVDFESGRMGDVRNIKIDEHVGELENRTLLSGYENGILITTNSSLLQYDVETGEVTQLLDWSDDHVNMDGSLVTKILLRSADAAAQLPDGMAALCHDTSNGEAEIVKIFYEDKAYVPDKQVVRLATMYSGAVTNWVNNFNRSSRAYKVELLEYESLNEFTESLLLNQGEMPDLLDVSFIDVDMLNGKGLLTDMAPYFEQSELVKQEDILEQIWDGCNDDGRISSMICSFSFVSYETSADDIPTDGWSYDDFLALEDKYPESRPLMNYREMMVWNLFAMSGADDFIDWDKKKSNYDSKEFRRLITKIKELDRTSEETIIYDSEEQEISRMLSEEFLLLQTSYSSPYWYRRVQNKYRMSSRTVGFPTADGSPCFLISPTAEFAIYDESANKDGAWAFIEFALSEEGQSWYGREMWAFPVRKEAFATYLELPHDPMDTNFADDNKTIDSTTALNYMLENSRIYGRRNSGEITTIVREELQAFFEDAKTAEETAKIIDNRVQLYLDENFYSVEE